MQLYTPHHDNSELIILFSFLYSPIQVVVSYILYTKPTTLQIEIHVVEHRSGQAEKHVT